MVHTTSLPLLTVIRWVKNAGLRLVPRPSRESNMAEVSKGKVVSQRSLRRRRRELRHRAQSLVEGATDPWEEVEEYETDIPEGEEDEFIDEETAEVAEEVIEFTYTIRELGAEMILGGDCFLESLMIVRSFFAKNMEKWKNIVSN